jgi:hypothetical protein
MELIYQLFTNTNTNSEEVEGVPLENDGSGGSVVSCVVA